MDDKNVTYGSGLLLSSSFESVPPALWLELVAFDEELESGECFLCIIDVRSVRVAVRSTSIVSPVV